MEAIIHKRELATTVDNLDMSKLIAQTKDLTISSKIEDHIKKEEEVTNIKTRTESTITDLPIILRDQVLITTQLQTPDLILDLNQDLDPKVKVDTVEVAIDIKMINTENIEITTKKEDITMTEE